MATGGMPATEAAMAGMLHPASSVARPPQMAHTGPPAVPSPAQTPVPTPVASAASSPASARPTPTTGIAPLMLTSAAPALFGKLRMWAAGPTPAKSDNDTTTAGSAAASPGTADSAADLTRHWLAMLGHASAPAARARAVREIHEAIRTNRLADVPLLLAAVDVLATVRSTATGARRGGWGATLRHASPRGRETSAQKHAHLTISASRGVVDCGRWHARILQSTTVSSDLRQLAQQTVLVGLERQYDALSDLERAQVYAALRQLPSLDDLPYRLAVMRRLTKDGRELAGLETTLVPLLLAWLAQLLALDAQRRRTRQADLAALVGLLASVVKFSFVVMQVSGDGAARKRLPRFNSAGNALGS